MPTVATGIDPGAGAAKVVQIRRARGGYELLAAATARRDAGGPDVPPAETLADALHSARVRPKGAVLATGGPKTILRYIPVPPVPPWKLKMMMQYEVDEGVAGGGASAYDYRRLEIESPQGGSVVMLGLAQEEMLEEGLRAAHRAGLREPVFDFSVLGLFAAYQYGHGAERGETVAVMDVGESQVGVVIAQGDRLLFARSAPGGGSRFTRAVETAFSLPRAEAEALKRDRGEILPPEDVQGPGPDGKEEPAAPAITLAPDGAGPSEASGAAPKPSEGARQRASEALVREAGNLASTLEGAITYCRAQLGLRELKLDRVLLSGGAAALRGLEEYLSRRLRLAVEALCPLRRVSLGRLRPDAVAELESNVGRYAVAVGLALSRLEPGAVRFEILPRAVQRRRAFLERDLYLWYAAAAFAIALGLMVYTPLRNRAALARESRRQSGLLEEAKKKQEKFAEVYARYERARAEVDALQERVLSGQDILDVFQALRHLTARFDAKRDFRNVWIAELSTHPPALKKFEKEPNLTFQQARRLYLRGYATTEDPRTVPGYIEEYIKHLTGSSSVRPDGLFVPYSPRDPENEARSRFPYQSDSSEEVGPKTFRREFVFQLVLRPSVREKK